MDIDCASIPQACQRPGNLADAERLLTGGGMNIADISTDALQLFNQHPNPFRGGIQTLMTEGGFFTGLLDQPRSIAGGFGASLSQTPHFIGENAISSISLEVAGMLPD
jgi:hypothetical protein